jgi:GntR family transcriptional regulator
MLDKNSPKPLYAQLDELFRGAIENNAWRPNEMIPSELELSRIYGVSRMTARSVITQLVRDGLLRRVQGKGTFVVEPKISAKSPAYMGVREQLERMGYQTQTRLLDFRVLRAGTRLTNVFQLNEGAPLYYVKRLRYAGEEPISLHESYMPQELCPNLTSEQMETEQLCVILKERYNLTAVFVSETLESVSARLEESKALNVEKRFPLLLLEDINKSKDEKVFEYTKVLFRGDKIKLFFEYDSERR